jgi:hypothetical protein
MADTVYDGALVTIDPNDQRVFIFDWGTDNLAAGVTITAQAYQVIGRRPSPATIASITRVSTTATATTSAVHGLTTGDVVTVAGCVQDEYNITATVTVTTTTAFTYTVSGTPATPATTLDVITLSQGLDFDNSAILTAAPYSSRSTQVRLDARGDTYRGRKYEVANTITTDESPTQTKQRSFFALIQNK